MTPDVPRSTRDLLREHRVFTGIVLVAIALRIAAVLPVHFSAFSSDEGEFIYLGHRLADGQEFIDSNAERSVRAPLYPLLLAASFKVIGAGLTFPYILSALAGGIGAGCVYLLALRILRDQRAAFFAGIGAAVYPGLVIAGALLHTEALYIVFFLLVILLAYRIIDGKGVPDAAALGILAGVAALTRAVFVGFFPILLAVLWWMRKKSGRPAILPVVVALAMFAAVLTPWTVRNYEVHGAFVPVSTFGWSSFLIGNNPFVHWTPELGRGFDAWF